MHDLAPFIGFVAAHSGLAYGLVLLLAFSESVPVIGALVPGTAVIIAIAALVPTGAVRMWPLLAAAVAGAILGDGVSYWLGHRYGEAIVARWPLKGYPEFAQRSRQFIERHGGKSVFLARFAPGVRAFVPISAGMLGMPTARFYLVNILSALVWAPAHILPGALVGASLTFAGAAAGRLALLLIVLIGLVWIVRLLVRIAIGRGPALMAITDAQLRRWTEGRDTWMTLQVHALLDPERGETRALLIWSAVVIGSAWLFFGVLEDVVSGDPLVRLDAAVYRGLQGLRSPAGDFVMIGVTELGDPVVVAAVAVLGFLWLAWRRHWRTATYWAGAIGFASLLNTAVKLAIHRPRPDALGYSGASHFSFPSGHATVNAVMYGLLAFLIARQLRLRQRIPVAGVALSFVILIAFSRLYLGAHWFSDVIGSFAFAAAWIVIIALAYGHHRGSDIDWRGLAAVAGASLVLIGGSEIYRRHTADTKRYAAHYEVPSIDAAAWRNGGWRQQPAYRIDVTGEMEEPLTLQWAGPRLALEEQLLHSGWQRAPSWTFAGALAWLATTDPQKLPVAPLLESGRLPGLALIRLDPQAPHARYVLRLWPADIDLRNEARHHLWLGSIVEERIIRPLSLLSISHIVGDYVRPRDLLRGSLPGSLVVKRAMTGPGWDGHVVLGHAPSVQPGPGSQVEP